MPEYKTLSVPDRAAWRAWLEKHHAREPGIWLVYYKGGVHPTLSYEDSILEALCFGWIDSIIKKVDEDKYVRKFTPRTPGSDWSLSNKRRIARLIREELMTPAGMDRVDYAHPEREPSEPPSRTEPLLPAYFKRALVANGRAWENFKNLSPSYRRLYVRWVLDAKRAETRDKRVRESVALLAENKKLGLR